MTTVLPKPSSGPIVDEAVPQPAITDIYTGPLVNLRVLKTAIWDRWRIWLSIAFAGMLIGLALHLVVPVKYSSVTELYLTEPLNADPSLAMANDQSLASTTAVARGAVDSLHLRSTPTSFLSTYQVVGVSDAIMSITASGPSPVAAVLRANAIAQAFLMVRSHELRLQTSAVTSQLRTQVHALQSQANKLTSEINSLPAIGSQSAQLTDLVNQRGADDSQITQLHSQIAQDQANQDAVITGSNVIDPATANKVSSMKVFFMDGLTGLVIGLGVGIVVLTLLLLLTDRLRTREEVATVLGLPVELSISRGVPRSGRVTRLIRTGLKRKLPSKPSTALQMMERRLRTGLERSPDAALALVEIRASEAAALAVVLLARSLSREERRVVLVDMARGRPLVSLFGGEPIGGGRYTASFGGKPVVLIEAPSDPAEIGTKTADAEEADATIVLATVDPSLPPDHLAEWAAEAIVVLDTRKARSALIGSTGELLRRAGLTPQSAIVIGGDPRDDSIGVPEAEQAPIDLEAALGV